MKRTYCVDDPAMAHATIADDIERTIESTVAMVCEDGYAVHPVGIDLKMTCKADTPEKGKWVGNGECKSMSLTIEYPFFAALTIEYPSFAALTIEYPSFAAIDCFKHLIKHLQLMLHVNNKQILSFS